MTSVHRQSRVVRFCLALVAILVLAGLCFGQPAVSLSPKDGPPTTTLRVSGSGFTSYAQIDIYFDSQDEALVVADAAGAFSQVVIQAPKSAVPGNHWVTAAERSGRLVKQEIFEVHVNWDQFHTRDMHRENPYENVLGVDNVGSLILKKGCNKWVASSAAVVNDVVYIGGGNGILYALNTRTGATLWTYDTGHRRQLSSPAVANGVVFFHSWSINEVYALNADTGAPLWSYQTGDWVPPKGYRGESDAAPTVANGVVYVTAYDRNVYALDASTGVKLWSYPTGTQSDSSPAVANGVVYVGTGNVYALEARTGTLLWYYASIVSSSPAIANGTVYVGSTDVDGNILALDARTGTLLWKSYAGNNFVFSSPAVADGVVYVGSDDNNVYALDASTGALLWSYYASGYSELRSSPAVANGVVYVGGADSTLYALDAKTGGVLWSWKDCGMWVQSPTVANGVLYMGTGCGFSAFVLPKELAPQPPPRPDPKTLRPDFSLKPVSTTE